MGVTNEEVRQLLGRFWMVMDYLQNNPQPNAYRMPDAFDKEQEGIINELTQLAKLFGFVVCVRRETPTSGNTLWFATKEWYKDYKKDEGEWEFK